MGEAVRIRRVRDGCNGTYGGVPVILCTPSGRLDQGIILDGAGELVTFVVAKFSSASQTR